MIGEALCNVCCEPVTERLEAAVTDIVLYCVVLYCSVSHSIILLLWDFVVVVAFSFLFFLRRGPGGGW